MANLALIRDLCDEKKITLKELSEAISISQNGLQRIIKDNSTKIETLEKIADYFEIPVTDFFISDKKELLLVKELEQKIVVLEKLVETLSIELNDKRYIINDLIERGAISNYNLITPKENRGIEYLEFNDLKAVLASLENSPLIQVNDKNKLINFLNDLAAKNRSKKQ